MNLKEEQIAEIKKLRSEWYKLREIAEKVWVTLVTVSYWSPQYTPKWQKATQREYYLRNRETIIARNKSNYHAKKSTKKVLQF